MQVYAILVIQLNNSWTGPLTPAAWTIDAHAIVLLNFARLLLSLLLEYTLAHPVSLTSTITSSVTLYSFFLKLTDDKTYAHFLAFAPIFIYRHKLPTVNISEHQIRPCHYILTYLHVQVLEAFMIMTYCIFKFWQANTLHV